jgi:hypothetical protein
VASSGSFFSLEHGGRQMLGLKIWRLVCPEHEGGGDGMKVYARVSRHEREKMQAITPPRCSINEHLGSIYRGNL